MSKDDKNIAVLEELSTNSNEPTYQPINADIQEILPNHPLSDNQKKQIAFNALRQTGLSIAKAGKLVGYESNHVYRLDKKRRAVILDTLAPKAKKAIANTLKGEKTGNAEKPKTSDVLAASKMVMDRVQPVIQRTDHRSVSVHMEVSEDERKQYLEALGLGSSGEE